MRRWEASAGVGPSFFFGDIGGFSPSENILGLKDMNYRQTRFDINGNVKYRITRTVNARVSFTYAMFHASDERGTNEARDYEATTSVFEPAILGEYYFIKNLSENSYLFLRRKEAFIFHILKSLDFYAFGGIGAALFTVNGNDELLTNASYVGNGFAPVIPVGLGTTLVYSPNMNIGLEVGGRYAFTDFLDGYSSQYSKSNDVYYFLNLTVTYKLKTGPNGLPRFRR
jgi:hypothetical protein